MNLPSRYQIGDDVMASREMHKVRGKVIAVEFTERKVWYTVESKNPLRIITVSSSDIAPLPRIVS